MPDFRGALMGKITRIEYDHATGVFRIMELAQDNACEYQTKDIWQVVQRVQNLICEVKTDRHWTRGSK